MVYELAVKAEGLYRYGAEPRDGSWHEVRPIDETPDDGRRFVYGAEAPTALGRAVRTEHVPTEMAWNGPAGTPIPDFEDSYFLNVSERARSAIEDIEPGVHQFLPVRYVDSAGSLIETRHVFVVCNRVASVDPATTTLILHKGMWRPAADLKRRSPEAIPAGFDVKQLPVVVFDEARVAGIHFWIDKHLPHQTFMSNTAAERLAAEGLTGLATVERKSAL
ncbi:MAG TPA: DUF1629 domain-containing protein [Allosphingosinicella sp.]|jgi:hypothetical protein